MWRFYAELFVLVVVAFTVGAAVAALVLRIVVKEKVGSAAPEPSSDPAAGTPGGAG